MYICAEIYPVPEAKVNRNLYQCVKFMLNTYILPFYKVYRAIFAYLLI